MSENSTEKPPPPRIKTPRPAPPAEEDNSRTKRIRIVVKFNTESSVKRDVLVDVPLDMLVGTPVVPPAVPPVVPPKKRKRVPEAQVVAAPVQQPGMLGGSMPIIITADGAPVNTPGPPTKRRKLNDPEPRNNIALFTSTAQTEDEVKSDYLFQALKQIRTNKIFAGLLAATTNLAPEDWADVAMEQEALAEKERSLSLDLCKLLAKVDKSVGIVVIDRSGFPNFTGQEPQALYMASTHTIELAENTSQGLPAPMNEGGGYWQYLSRSVFEMCNATQRKACSAVYAAAADGTLDCLSYALAMEVIENQTESSHVTYWKKAIANVNCCTVLDEATGNAKKLKVTSKIKNLGYKAETNLVRLGDAIASGHVMSYILGWLDAYAKVYAAKNAGLDAAFTAWSKGTGGAPKIDHGDVIEQLTGLQVDPLMVQAMRRHVKAWYGTPMAYIAHRSDPYVKPAPKRPARRKATAKATPTATIVNNAANLPGQGNVPAITPTQTTTNTRPAPSQNPAPNAGQAPTPKAKPRRAVLKK